MRMGRLTVRCQHEKGENRVEEGKENKKVVTLSE